MNDKLKAAFTERLLSMIRNHWKEQGYEIEVGANEHGVIWSRTIGALPVGAREWKRAQGLGVVKS